MKFSVVQTFSSVAKASIPDEERPGQFRQVEFTCRFRSQSNEPAKREALQRKQDDEGLYAFLGETLVGVQFKGEFEFEDEEGAPVEPIEWVKRNQFAAAAASIAFWDVVNRDVETKNSRRLRGR